MTLRDAQRQYDFACDCCGEHDVSERVAERIAAMRLAEFRELRDHYRFRCRLLGHRPYGFRFGAWLRDRMAVEVAADQQDAADYRREHDRGDMER